MTEDSIKSEQFCDIVKVEEEITSPYIDVNKCISSPKHELAEPLNEKQVSINSLMSNISQQISIINNDLLC